MSRWTDKFVSQEGQGWKAWDETQAYEIDEGRVYATKAEAVAAVIAYGKLLNERAPC